MFCKKCGKPIPEWAVFCPLCGADLRKKNVPVADTAVTDTYESDNSIYKTPLSDVPASDKNQAEVIYEQPDLTVQPTEFVTFESVSNEKKPKKKVKKIIAACISVLLVLAIAFSGIYIFVIKADDWYYVSYSADYSYDEDGNVYLEIIQEISENEITGYTNGETSEKHVYDKHGKVIKYWRLYDNEMCKLDLNYEKIDGKYTAHDKCKTDNGSLEIEMTYNNNHQLLDMTLSGTADGEKRIIQKEENKYRNGKLVRSKRENWDGMEFINEFNSNGEKTYQIIKNGSSEITHEFKYKDGKLSEEISKKKGEEDAVTVLNEKDGDTYKYVTRADGEICGYTYVYYDGDRLVKQEFYDANKKLTNSSEKEYSKKSFKHFLSDLLYKN